MSDDVLKKLAEKYSDENYIDKYISSDTIQNLLDTRAFIAAIAKVLIDKGLMTDEEFDASYKAFKVVFEKAISNQIKEEINKIKGE